MRADRRVAGAALLLFAASLALFWPGIAMYDTVAQYGQVLSGDYEDWHPPTMARLWSVLAPLGPGAAPMLVLQLGLYWLGLGLVAAGLARIGRSKAAVAVLAIGTMPSFLGWEAVVLKDGQMAAALLAATGLVAWWRLTERRLPAAAVVGVTLLLGYATLVRANAVFAAAPLAAMLLPQPRALPGRIGVALAIAVLALAIEPVIAHRLLGARPTGVERTEAVYDLAGIAARVPTAADTGLLPGEIALIVRRRCSRPFFWDPMGEPAHCGAIMDRAQTVPVSTLYGTLAVAVAHHPLAYAAQRAGHLNSTFRWLVPLGWPSAAPPLGSEPNTIGLASPGPRAVAWQRLAGMLVETPVGWPVAWLSLALIAWAAAAGAPAGPARELARALLASALAMEASFAVLSIASDLRYHLWSMIAVAVATVLLADRPPPRRILIGGAVMLALVVGAGLVARATLPRSPTSYTGMLG